MNAAFRITPLPRPGVRVLVVHSDAAERERAGRALSEDGFAVEGAASGVEAALRVSDSDRPRLVVAFCGPDEAVEIVTAARALAPPVQVVLVLPRGDARAELRARRVGVAAVFRGPVDLDDLRTAVLNLAPRRGVHASGVYGRGLS